jgi:hypothetical protein
MLSPSICFSQSANFVSAFAAAWQHRADERKVVGYLGRGAILSARLLRFHDEHVREPGWLTTSRQHSDHRG